MFKLEDYLSWLLQEDLILLCISKFIIAIPEPKILPMTGWMFGCMRSPACFSCAACRLTAVVQVEPIACPAPWPQALPRARRVPLGPLAGRAVSAMARWAVVVHCDTQTRRYILCLFPVILPLPFPLHSAPNLAYLYHQNRHLASPSRPHDPSCFCPLNLLILVFCLSVYCIFTFLVNLVIQ